MGVILSGIGVVVKEGRGVTDKKGRARKSVQVSYNQ